jgi:predicted nucleic acid-binding protein
MTYLLDTNALSDLMRAHPRLDHRLATLSAEDIAAVCPIVRGEVMYGLARLPEGHRQAALAAKADALLAVILCIPLPPTAGDCYARVKIARQQGGLSLDENDLWIAATALAINATLVSRDHDFRRIEGLRVEDWTV